MTTAGCVVFEKSHSPYSTLFSVSQVPRFTVEVVIKNGTPWPFKYLRIPGRRRLGTAMDTPVSPGNYPHDVEKHWPKPFKLEEQAVSREI